MVPNTNPPSGGAGIVGPTLLNTFLSTPGSKSLGLILVLVY